MVLGSRKQNMELMSSTKIVVTIPARGKQFLHMVCISSAATKVAPEFVYWMIEKLHLPFSQWPNLVTRAARFLAWVGKPAFPGRSPVLASWPVGETPLPTA